MPGPVFLEGDEVTLRSVEQEDMEFVQRTMNDPEVWRPAMGAEPMNDELASEFFEDVVSSEGDVHCLICDDEEPMGVVSLTRSQYGPDETARSRDAELAYYLAPEFHGQGYGSDAAETMVEYAFEDLNLRRVSARCGSFNEGSAALLESLGFEQEGRLREASWYRGEYYDTLWYGLLRREWRERRAAGDEA
ncbi:MAG TPA: GNAT family protein [Natrialbaceae archaeon]|nr:GNAT family protein [Natrialbaceae archaeon]